MESLKADSYFQRKKLNCPERDLNPQSLAYMTSALTTKPPRQLSGRGGGTSIHSVMGCVHLSVLLLTVIYCVHSQVGNCVAKRNYRYFYLFLTTVGITGVYMMACNITVIVLGMLCTLCCLSITYTLYIYIVHVYM